MNSFKETIKNNFLSASSYISIVCSLIVLNNSYWIYKSIYTKSFSIDEIQHTHLAWNTFSGLTIYKDFFDHHGPLFALLNSIFFKSLENPASFESIILLRQLSFLYGLIIVFLIFLIAKKISRSTSLAFIATTIITSWNVFQIHCIEIRPDIIQTCFLLLGFYLYLQSNGNHRLKYLILSGISFGIMISFNFKTIIVIFCLAIYQIIKFIVHKDRNAPKKFFTVILGVLIPITLIMIYFQTKGCLNQYLYFNTLYNFKLANSGSTASFAMRLSKESFLDIDILLTALLIFSFLTTQSKDKNMQLLYIFSTIPLYGTFKGLFPYYSFIYLPFCSILIAYFITYLMKLAHKSNLLTLTVIFITLIISPTQMILQKPVQDKRSHLKFNQAKTLIQWTTQNIPRDEIILIQSFFFNCPAYVFNKDYRYKWWSMFGINLDGDFSKVNYICKNPYKNNRNISLTKALKAITKDDFTEVEINGKKSCLLKRRNHK